MIDTYQTPEARELLDRIGWPEWAGKGVAYALSPLGDSFWRTMPGRQHNAMMNIISDHEALCLLRNHLREWIAAKRVHLETGISGTGSDCVMLYGEAGDEWTDDYDEALLANAREVLKAA